MKYALFLGCKIPSGLPAYETSTRAVLGHLGVELVDLEFQCCGYPARNYDRDAFVVAATRNLALAERHALDVLTPCMCCFGTLRQAIRMMNEDAPLRTRVSRSLADDGLAWSGRTRVQHVLPLLAREIGVDALKAAVRAPRSPGMPQPGLYWRGAAASITAARTASAVHASESGGSCAPAGPRPRSGCNRGR